MKNVQCARCLMDTTAVNITFDINGNCNFCTDFLKVLEKPKKRLNLSLDDLIKRIKLDGRGKPYDCILGISGGVDSAYTLVKAKEYGLRPLAVHMDNGWNSELATTNIKNLVEKLDVDLYTHVINWEEYRELMQAFFDADVIDIELLYDNAMLAVNYQQASKYNIKYILAGSNTATEGMRMPNNWNWLKFDKKNIRKIARLRKVKLKTFPSIGTIGFIYNEFVKSRKWVSFLDYLTTYNKFDAITTLQEKYLYKPYPYKHYESVFTRFYQGYLLPRKFGVDKRKVHLSTLVLTGQLLKETALKQAEGIAYESLSALEADISFFLKKMGWSREQLEQYIQRPEKSHLLYGSEKKINDLLRFFYKKIYRQ